MSARPWHKRYHSDALTGYRGLTLEERGAYTTILDLLYDSGEEALPASERWMAGHLDVSTRKWRTLRDDLSAAGKIDILPDGRITNARYLRERAKITDLTATRAEAGAKGGKAKAAAVSASVQPEFAMFSTPENDLSGKDNIDEQDAKPAENGQPDLANAKAKPPIRARDPEARVQNQSNERESGDDNAAREIGERTVVRGKGLGEGASAEGKSLFDQVCDAAGYNPISPTHIAQAHDFIRGWRDAGISFEDIVLPTIKNIVANSNDPTSSLIRFDRHVRHQHAKHGATPASATYKPPASPILDQPGEEECFAPMRADLLKRLGPATFARYVNPVLFETVPDAPVGRIMRVTDKRNGPMMLMHDDRATAVRAVAKKHGFDDVW